MKGENKPRKRIKPPLKHIQDKKKLPADIEGKDDIENLIKSALAEMVSIPGGSGKRSLVKNELRAMVSTCSEFMNNFIILGYDLKGNPIPPTFYAKSQLEIDALSYYLRQYLFSIDSYVDEELDS